MAAGITAAAITAVAIMAAGIRRRRAITLSLTVAGTMAACITASHYRGRHRGRSHHVYRSHGHNKHWNRGIYRRGYGWGRWYHGVWWAYGVGSCWRLVPGGWVWVCY